MQFRYRLCFTMVVDYGGAWIAEIVLKYLFADNQPKVCTPHPTRCLIIR